ncbi:MAG TPA: DUF4344 domain-containing metallopeptidase [Longimicrobium sp.]|jgi:hypothetical protein
MRFGFVKVLACALPLLAAGLLASCGEHAEGADARPPARRVAPPAAPPAPAPAGLTGRFVVAYDRVREPVYAKWEEEFRRARFLEGIASWLNDWIALPRNVTLRFSECQEPNAFYDEETDSVVLCYELVEDLDRVFADEEDIDQAVDDALVFTTLHEVGHALVHVLELPVTGREEDAVDQLAALVLIDGTEEGEAAAVNGVRGLPDDGEEVDELVFADEHALSLQRFYNVVCLIYGQNPQFYAGWVGDGTLPQERAERCPAEYDRAVRAWDALLGPYLRG